MTTDILALVSMKNAAKCEKPCELHNTWIIKSLNASGAWEVASKHVCLRVVFIIANYFFFSFIHSLLWLIDWFGRVNCLWFVSSDFIDFIEIQMRWIERVIFVCLFVCFTHFVICVILIDFWIAQWNCKLNEWKQRKMSFYFNHQPTNEPNQFQLTLICDWLIDWLLVTSSTFFLWLIDRCLWWIEWIWIIDWLIVVVNWEKLACFLLSILSSILSFFHSLIHLLFYDLKSGKTTCWI